MYGIWFILIQMKQIQLLAAILTPWSRVILEKLTGSRLVQKFQI